MKLLFSTFILGLLMTEVLYEQYSFQNLSNCYEQIYRYFCFFTLPLKVNRTSALTLPPIEYHAQHLRCGQIMQFVKGSKLLLAASEHFSQLVLALLTVYQLRIFYGKDVKMYCKGIKHFQRNFVQPLNPLGSKSGQHQFSPNNISRSSRVKVMRITKLITKGRML